MTSDRTLRYVIFVPRGPEFEQALARCLEFVGRTDWISEGVIIGRWDAVMNLVWQELVEVVVIAHRAHLPPDRTPRLVVVDEELIAPAAADTGGPQPPGQRRPRQILR